MMFRHIQEERRRSGVRKTFSNFGLSLSLSILLLASWIAQAIAQWQEFVDDQKEHGEPTRVVDYLQEFSQATLGNWQSEFLQLFSFVVLTALLIHRGSAESKDGDDRMEEAPKRIEKKLWTAS